MRLCVFIGDMYRDFALSVLRHLDYYAREKGYRVDVFGTFSVPSTNPLHVIGLKSILSLPDISSFDGIIVCYDTLVHEGMAKDLIEEINNTEAHPPLVCIRSGLPGTYQVLPDNRQMMHDIAAYVISKCHSADIGFVTGNLAMPDSYERWDGFNDAMAEAGYETSDDLVFRGNYWITQAVETADHFIKPDGTLPEAIICSNDYEALALCDELVKRGYSIPGDTLISGIDNTLEGENHIPSLTTIEIAKSDFVDAAIQAIIDLKSGKDIDLNIPVPSVIIPRESTGDPTGERDIYKMLCDLTANASSSMDDKHEYVILSAMFEGALTMKDLLNIALEQLREIPGIRSCFLCRYRENDHELAGYFKDKGDITVDGISFESDRTLPKGIVDDDCGMYIGFPLSYKNDVYGYAVLVVDTTDYHFIDFKTEFLLTLVGQNINKLELYEKLFGISDVISLYIKDPLTGVLNRRGFEKKLSEKFDKDGNPVHPLTIVSLDMDDLKYVNDNFGHLEGDDALKTIADSIAASLTGNEFVARMGGDEFSAILDTSDPNRTAAFISSFNERIGKINDSGRSPYKLSASIGSCDLTTWNDLMDCMNTADKAMYSEKRAKKKARD